MSQAGTAALAHARPRWLASKVTPSAALGVAGLAVILIANARPIAYRNGEAVSAYRWFFPLSSPESWLFVEFILVPILVAAGLGLIASERTRRVGAGLLVAVGVEGYAAGLVAWTITIATAPQSFGPRSGGLFFLIGCSLAGAAGLLVHARGGGTSAGQGVRWPVRAVAAIGALGLLLGATVSINKAGEVAGEALALVSLADGAK